MARVRMIDCCGSLAPFRSTSTYGGMLAWEKGRAKNEKEEGFFSVRLGGSRDEGGNLASQFSWANN